MEKKNGIHEKKSGDTSIMINVTDRIVIAMKKNDCVGVVSLRGDEVQKLFDEWCEHNNFLNTKSKSRNDIKLMKERNQVLFERVYDQHTILLMVREAFGAILSNENNHIDGITKQLIHDVKLQINDELIV